MFVKSCENHFCVYWKGNNQCKLKNISLDIQGNCLDCIYVEIEPTILKNARKQMQERFNE